MPRPCARLLALPEDRIATLVEQGQRGEARHEAQRLLAQVPGMKAERFASLFTAGGAALRDRRLDALRQHERVETIFPQAACCIAAAGCPPFSSPAGSKSYTDAVDIFLLAV